MNEPGLSSSRAVPQPVFAVALLILFVIVATAGYYGWQRIEALESEVSQLDAQSSAAEERLEDISQVAVNAFASAIGAESEVRKLSGANVTTTSVSDVLFALQRLEACVSSIVDVAEGRSSRFEAFCP